MNMQTIVAAPRGASSRQDCPKGDRRLLVAIHDVSPRFEQEIDQLVELVERHLGGQRFAMLVVPDHWGSAPIARNGAFRAKLRRHADLGVEMFVHGWFHRDDTRHSGMAGLKARHMTAGEGEFSGLSRLEASRRMAEGRAAIEDCIGRKVAGFIAPAWLYSVGTLEALADNGFALAEDHLRVWLPETTRVVSRGPVVTWASRSPTRVASSIAFAALARRALTPCDTVRLAVHPGDTGNARIMASIEKTFAHFAARRTPARYADLLAEAGNGFFQPAAFT